MVKTLIVVLGPTGIGKSDLSIRLARFFKTEIISSDSRQIFRELSIGTAVPSPSDLQKVKHHLIHSHSVHDDYNASRFEEDALKILNQIFEKKNVAVLTGGSMFYIDAVCNGIDDLPNVDPKIRGRLIAEYEEKGIEHLRLQLKKMDPVYYSNVDLKNSKRILHALEICLMTGKPYSSFRKDEKKKRPFRTIKIGLNTDRKMLYQRINQRVDRMIGEGLVNEAKQNYPFRGLNALNTVGYKELFAYFEGKTNLEEAIDLIKRNSRRYARKQLTWFRKDTEINWFLPDQENKIIDFLVEKLTE